MLTAGREYGGTMCGGDGISVLQGSNIVGYVSGASLGTMKLRAYYCENCTTCEAFDYTDYTDPGEDVFGWDVSAQDGNCYLSSKNSADKCPNCKKTGWVRGYFEAKAGGRWILWGSVKWLVWVEMTGAQQKTLGTVGCPKLKKMLPIVRQLVRS